MDVTELEMSLAAIQQLRTEIAVIRATQIEQGNTLAVVADKAHSQGDCPSIRAVMRDVRFAKGALWALGLLAVPTLGGVVLLAIDRLSQ